MSATRRWKASVKGKAPVEVVESGAEQAYTPMTGKWRLNRGILPKARLLHDLANDEEKAREIEIRNCLQLPLHLTGRLWPL